MSVELIFVDDGSTDATSALIRQYAAGDDRIRLIRFARNFGHQIAARIVNTVAGYGTFLLLLHGVRWNPWFANAGSYAVGLVVAYVLNLRFVFRDSSHSAGVVLRFLLGFAISYVVNVGVMQLMLSGAKLRPEYVQLFAMASYTVSFYLFNKFFVYTARPLECNALDTKDG